MARISLPHFIRIGKALSLFNLTFSAISGLCAENSNLDRLFLSKLNLKTHMLRLSRLTHRFICIPNSSLQSLYARSGRHCYPRKCDGEDNEDFEKGIGDEEGKFYFFKRKGQHILTNQRILDSIVRKSSITPMDTVLEIGPGTGNLTLKLLEVAEKVVAVEIDKRMVEILLRRVAERGFEDRLTVICKDALKAEFPPFNLVVANIPYGISSPLLAKLLYGSVSYRSATLLLQKEYAQRLMANPGDGEYNRLAVNVKLVADVELMMNVSKREFVPPPKVDSSVVIIRPKMEVPSVNMEEWLGFTRICFSKKNKTLGAIFKQKSKVMEVMKLSEKMASSSASSMEVEMRSMKEKVIGVMKSGGFEEKRPAKLTNDELLRLLALFNQAGIHFHGGLNLNKAEEAPFADAFNS